MSVPEGVKVASGPSDDVDDPDGVDDIDGVGARGAGEPVADRRTSDDADERWRPPPGRVGERPATDADPTGHTRSPVRTEAIVLGDDTDASSWARPHDGAASGIVGDVPDTAVDDAAPAAPTRDPTEVVVDDGAHPTPNPEKEATTVRRVGRRSVAVVAVVAVAALVGAAIAVVVPGTRDDGSTPVVASSPRLPDGAELAWTSRVEGQVVTAAAGDGLVVVVSDDGLTVLGDADGRVLWRRVNAADAGAIERAAVIDGLVVATQQSTSGTSEVRVFDPVSGTELWRTRGRDGTHSLAGPSHDPLIVGRRRIDGATTLVLLEPADGSSLGDPVTLSGIAAAGDDLAIAPTDRQVAVWSPDVLEVVAGPVDEFNLRTVAELAGSVVALDLEGRIVAFDTDGRRSDELLLFGPGETIDGSSAIADVDLVGVTSTDIALVSGPSSLGVRVVAGRIETVWERPGFATAPVPTVRGDRSVLVVRSESGSIGEVIVDPADGRVVAPIDSPGQRERLTTLAWDGYVVAPVVEAEQRTLAAFDYDGVLRWSLSLAAGADYEVTPDGVVVIEPTAGGADVSLAR